MPRRPVPEPPAREITSESHYLRRREFLRNAAWVGAGATLGCGMEEAVAAPEPNGETLAGVVKSPLSTDEKPNPFADAASYNNFYEFGTGKDDPARYAHTLRTRPWNVRVDGEVGKPGEIGIEDLLRPHTLEERVYRFRCVRSLVDGDSVGGHSAR